MNIDAKDFFSGDSIKWTVSHPEYKPSEYDCKVIFTNNDTKHELDTTKQTSTWVLEIADTGGILTGRYKIYVLFSKTGFKKTEFANYVNVGNNVDVTATEDIISYNQKMLDAIEDLLFKRTETDYSSYTIGNRSIVKMTPDSLLKWRNYFKDLVEKEEMKKNGKRDVIKVRWVGRFNGE